MTDLDASDREPPLHQHKPKASPPPPLTLAPSLRLKRQWQMFQGGFFAFPLLPIWGGIVMGLSVLWIWQQKYRKLLTRPPNRALGLLGLLMLLSATEAYQPVEAFLGAANFLPFFIAPVALGVLIQTPAQLRRLAWLFVLPALPIALLGCGQLFAGWQSPDFLFALFGWTLKADGYPEGRMASVFMYANILAAYFLVVLSFALGLWIETDQRRRDRLEKMRHDWVQLVFLSLVIAGSAIALFFTSSRNGWGIAVLVSLAFALFLGWRWLVLSVSTAVALILWAAVGPTFGRSQLRQIIPSSLWSRLSGEMYVAAAPDLRINQWQFTWEMIQERPWFGWGLRNFSPLYEEHTHFWLGHPHNLWLMFAAETGIPATLLLCGIVGWIVARAVLLLRIWSRALRPQWYRDRIILLTYLVAFGSLTLFNCLDVTIFDLRLNVCGWILLSCLGGVTYRYRILFPWQTSNSNQ